jgi:hypothetical protein
MTWIQQGQMTRLRQGQMTWLWHSQMTWLLDGLYILYIIPYPFQSTVRQKLFDFVTNLLPCHVQCLISILINYCSNCPVSGSLNKKGERKFHLCSIFGHSVFLGSLVKDGIFSIGGRKRASLLIILLNFKSAPYLLFASSVNLVTVAIYVRF